MINVNNNFAYARAFAKTVIKLGLRYVCISPGSRNTPLALAFAREKKLKKLIILDERSSAFYALGLARKTAKPVAIITTSGTAVAELYPAVAEAYNSHVPLLLLTADRPPELHGAGANQTITQENIFEKNITACFNAGLPATNKKSLKKIVNIARNAYSKACEGPVHVNFPFRKPLEPFSFNARLDTKFLDSLINSTAIFTASENKNLPQLNSILKKISRAKKILIFSGGGNFEKRFGHELLKFARKIGAPIIADAYSPLKFMASATSEILVNTASICYGNKKHLFYESDLLLHFGNAPTASSLLDFYRTLPAEKIAIDRYGELHDPSRTVSKILKINPLFFLQRITHAIEPKEKEWSRKILIQENKAENFKERFLKTMPFNFEGKLIYEILKKIPDSANVFVSNSMPIRDLDYFAPRFKKNITIFSNRGVSGIDGIISTAGGIAYASKNPTFLITGDLAFLHDLNGLATLRKYNINLTIFLINNNGGGIFRLLPIAREEKDFEEIFLTPHNLNFEKIANAFSLDYYLAKSQHDLYSLIKSNKKAGGKIIEIKTDSDFSTNARKRFWQDLSIQLQSSKEQ